MNAAVDNDVILKTVSYGLVHQILTPTCGPLESLGVLEAARFVVAHRIKKANLAGGQSEALLRLDAFLKVVATIETTDEEQRLAADFEVAAQRAGVSLDTGESHLCALVILRGLEKLLTGDKRAIAAIEALLDADNRLMYLCGRISCLEQLVYRATTERTSGSIRSAICQEPSVDKALTICSGCNNKSTEADFRECLESYFLDLRKRASRTLSS